MASIKDGEDDVSNAKRQKCNEKYEEKDLPVDEPSYDEIDENDLPLLSNIEKVKAIHYLMKLRFDMENQIVHGNLVLFLQWNILSSLKKLNEVILDCCSIKVRKVLCLKMENDSENQELSVEIIKPKKINWFTCPELKELKFVTTKWSLNIHGWPENEIPTVVRIQYETLPSTPSLHWRTSHNVDNNPERCVYTPASPVNNRGLFPCQEPPSAMSTWECFIELDSLNNYTALLASDEPGCPFQSMSSEFPGLSTYYFQCSMVLPMSTFAIAVGTIFHGSKNLVTIRDHNTSNSVIGSELMSSCKNHELYPCRFSSNHQTAANEDLIPVRLFSFSDNIVSPSLVKDISIIMTNLLSSAFAILGPHPFSRLDLVIMTKSFPSMGLANPNMIFFSPSVFYGCKFEGTLQRYTYVSRIAHEISHSWFGLLIGALDWTEEWLSEGFATFMEDILYKKTLLALENGTQQKLSEFENDIDEQLSIRSILRLMNLQNEMNNTEQDSRQVLSPTEKEEKCVKNALVPEKQFMQIHYLKGYFFLKYLSDLVEGDENFTTFLKSYVSQYHGQLVTSQMFLDYFQTYFSESLRVNKNFLNTENLQNKWLKNANLEQPYKSVQLLPDFENNKLELLKDNNKELIQLFPKCENRLRKLLQLLTRCFEENNFKDIPSLSSVELVYVLENVALQAGEMFSKTFCRALFKSLGFTYENMHNFIPEVLHCLSEIIIKIKDRKRLPIIEKFLLDHPAMGVYIYGELMISEKRSFQEMAKRVYHKQEHVLEKSILKVLKEMLF